MKTVSDELAATKAEKAATVKASVFDAAVKDGKIKPADREQWEKDYDEAPAAVTRVLASIAVGTAVPVMASGSRRLAEPSLDDDFDAMAPGSTPRPERRSDHGCLRTEVPVRRRDHRHRVGDHHRRQTLVVSGNGTLGPAGATAANVVGVAAMDAATATGFSFFPRGKVHVSVASGAITAGARVDSGAAGTVASGTASLTNIGVALTTAATPRSWSGWRSSPTPHHPSLPQAPRDACRAFFVCPATGRTRKVTPHAGRIPSGRTFAVR
jgi:hypothetical protein